MPLLAWLRHGVKPPDALARFGGVGVDEPGSSEFTSRDARDHMVSDDQGSSSATVTLLVRRHFHVPCDLPGPRLEGDEMSVESGEKHSGATQGHSSIHLPAAQTKISWECSRVGPEHGPRAGVEREYPIVPRRDEHDAVGDHRARLERGTRR